MEKSNFDSILGLSILTLMVSLNGVIMKDSSKFKVDRTHFTVDKLENQGDEVEFWKNKTRAERLEAIELIRQLQYGYDSDTSRLHRFFEVVKRK